MPRSKLRVLRAAEGVEAESVRPRVAVQQLQRPGAEVEPRKANPVSIDPTTAALLGRR